MSRGKFVTLDGNGGAGKSTLAAQLVARLNQTEGYRAVPWHFPDRRSPLGLVLRKFVQKELTLEPEALMPLFLADMAERAKELNATLDNGVTVVCDRYYFSTMVYQERYYPQGAIAATVEALHLPKPDLLVLLDLPVQAIVERLQARGTDGDRFDEVTRETLERYKVLYRGAALSSVAAKQTLWIDEPMSSDELLITVMAAILR